MAEVQYILSPRWKVSASGKQLKLQSESKQLKLELTESAEPIRELLTKENLNLNEFDKNLIKLLVSHSVIVRKLTHSCPATERQFIYWSAFSTLDCRQEKLHNLSDVHVTIIGLGGIGTVVARLLAGGGIKRFTFIDGDSVEASNLNRQILFNNKDIGASKVDSARRNLINAFPELNIETSVTDYLGQKPNPIFNTETDFVLVAFDGPTLTTPLMLLDELWESKVDCAFAFTGFDKTYASPIYSRQFSSSSPKESFDVRNDISDRSPIQASSSTNNAYVSALLAEQMLFHLTGLYEEVEYDKVLVSTRRQGYPSFALTEQIYL